MRVLLLVLLISGCGTAGLAVANGTALGVSTAALVCDWGMTRRAAEADWAGTREANPIMGSRPSTGLVDAYFLGALAVSALAWRLTPQRWRVIVPTAVLALQVDPLQHNLTAANPVDLGVCGVR